MKKSISLLFYITWIILVFQACSREPTETFTTGEAVFIADESFAPILDQELYVFKSIYQEANPTIIYKPENQAFNLFINDSIRVAILARELTESELNILKNRKLSPEINRFAIDAITLIVHKDATDTLMSVTEIKKMLNGEIKTDKNIVFDNPNSSIVRYLKKLSGNEKLEQKNIFALQSNVEVIKYVSENPQAIGIIGFSWVVEPEKGYAAAIQNIKVVGIRNDQSKTDADIYYKPSQTTLALEQYPLSRGLYILNSSGKVGLGTGFASFMASARGQRIILKSGLLPDSLPPREINIKN